MLCYINVISGDKYLSGDKWLVSVIKLMHEDATTKVRVNGRIRVRVSVLE